MCARRGCIKCLSYLFHRYRHRQIKKRNREKECGPSRREWSAISHQPYKPVVVTYITSIRPLLRVSFRLVSSHDSFVSRRNAESACYHRLTADLRLAARRRMLDRDTAIHLVAGGWVYYFRSARARVSGPARLYVTPALVGPRFDLFCDALDLRDPDRIEGD